MGCFHVPKRSYSHSTRWLKWTYRRLIPTSALRLINAESFRSFLRNSMNSIILFRSSDVRGLSQCLKSPVFEKSTSFSKGAHSRQLERNILSPSRPFVGMSAVFFHNQRSVLIRLGFIGLSIHSQLVGTWGLSSIISATASIKRSSRCS